MQGKCRKADANITGSRSYAIALTIPKHGILAALRNSHLRWSVPLSVQHEVY